MSHVAKAPTEMRTNSTFIRMMQHCMSGSLHIYTIGAILRAIARVGKGGAEVVHTLQWDKSAAAHHDFNII